VIVKRIAFKMKLYPGCEIQYRSRHEKIWPEMKSLLKNAGISDYAIFYDEETCMLFGTLKVNNMESFEALSSNPIMRTWWLYMSDIMETNTDKSPVSKALTEVFYLS